jgi:hypothetical protein
MTRATKSVSLALISSSLILSGCGQKATTRKTDQADHNVGDAEWGDQPGRPAYPGHGHTVYIPYVGHQTINVPARSPNASAANSPTASPGTSVGAGRSGVSTTSRGGFGASGVAATAGS